MNELEVKVLEVTVETAVKESFSLLRDAAGFVFADVKNKKAANDYLISAIKNSDAPDLVKAMQIANSKRMLKEYCNQADIVKIAIEQLSVPSLPERTKSNEDWIQRFMDEARFVSDDDMKILWGKVLAGELERPGKAPYQLIKILPSLSPDDAKILSHLFSLSVTFLSGKLPSLKSETYIVVPWRSIKPILSDFGITFSKLMEYQSLGILWFGLESGYSREFKNECALFVMHKEYSVEFNKFPSSGLCVGNVLLTTAGQYLYTIIPAIDTIDCWEHMLKLWSSAEYQYRSVKIRMNGDT